MLYTGYTKTELDALLAVLDSIPVTYEVLLEDGEVAKQRQRGGDATILRVDISEDALRAIPASFYPQLESFRIYPQYVDAPEGLFEERPAVDATSPEAIKKSQQSTWALRVIILGMALLMTYMMLRR